jgi:hypothetical protein
MTLADAMSTAAFYHVGILVADIENAVDRSSTALDLVQVRKFEIRSWAARPGDDTGDGDQPAESCIE